MIPPGELSFDTLCGFFETLSSKGKYLKGRSYNEKRRLIEALINRCILKDSRDAFAVFRLVLPKLDLERGSYSLQEHRFVNVLTTAAGLQRDHPKAVAAR